MSLCRGLAAGAEDVILALLLVGLGLDKYRLAFLEIFSGKSSYICHLKCGGKVCLSVTF